MPITILPGSYCGIAPPPEFALRSWNLDPVLLAVMAVGWLTVRHRPGATPAMLVLVVAFVSPLCAMSAGLFSARVVHHVLLVAVAAPLLAVALPSRPSGMGVHFAISTVLLWLWHLPVAYDLALRDIGVYWIMQISLLGSATLFWSAVLSHRASAQTVLWSLAGLIQMGMLGAILTFAPEPLYQAHQLAPLAWGMRPLTDQQLGGLIMWVPAMIPYAAVIAFQARRGWRLAAQG
ncbi:cytochrome c oxidase assembly protein [Paracoccus sp. 1_MG-2023]|uniref:cytochrome c oxidase assembly protein n=1 Tax=unclassified Paracoccus (in: a-proteobacteria) TaxID=2688777 RepID=UPI001C083932|nr:MULTISPECIES: cytochrome c oxidase assembly protein [unclassified Paracoccus (in: a-proteobacteria)]MBU2958355.1 cytochrome c oxidase assembly protein [Paracoccus sp. C2R09]MDO6670275.1 cytochrome c oxidase assembly protein [Paracoccus sp. 1_MG-2023]